LTLQFVSDSEFYIGAAKRTHSVRRLDLDGGASDPYEKFRKWQ